MFSLILQKVAVAGKEMQLVSEPEKVVRRREETEEMLKVSKLMCLILKGLTLMALNIMCYPDYYNCRICTKQRRSLVGFRAITFRKY